MHDNRTQIPLNTIDFEDERYRIADAKRNDALVEAIRVAGLINPPVVVESAGRHGIVAGYQRLQACLALDWRHVICRILPETTDPLTCLKIAISDNIWTRSLTLLEQARAVVKLTKYIDDVDEACSTARALGLSVNEALMDKYARLCRLPKTVQLKVAENVISLNVALDLGHEDAVSAVAVAEVFDLLKPTVNQQREMLAGLQDLARLEGIELSELLNRQSFAEILTSEHPDRKWKLQALRAEIRNRRYPSVVHAEKQFFQRRRNLNLPEGMALIPPANFEDTVYTLSLKFSSLDHLERLTETLARICRHSDLQAILDREVED